ncbi:MAG TPA: 6-phosphofructokinase, partial [Clostridiales bacterium]|nr:6-phosphofructokinase [Clostridiales bacterium]
MNQMKNNAVVGQSGGPTSAINATLAGVIRGAARARDEGKLGTLYGMRHGIEGFLSEDMVDLLGIFRDDADLDTLALTPAAALGSCRKKLKPAAEDEATYRRLFEIFEKYDIHFFFYIGGNDSMDTVAKLSAYAATVSYPLTVVGVPKTIDNDLAGTDHTPGFGSAAKYIAATMREILSDTAVYTVRAVTIVEIMGRDAGWLTAAAALPGLSGGRAPDLLYFPERPFDKDAFVRSVNAAFEKHPNVVVAISEGARYADGTYVGASA